LNNIYVQFTTKTDPTWFSALQ